MRCAHWGCWLDHRRLLAFMQRQNPQLAERIRLLPDLITARAVAPARADGDAACEQMHRHGLVRAREVQRVARIHRDPFETIIAVPDGG
ncbi:hypothetical protein J2S76_003337 [Ancylobacter vacuolatus]|uniref:Uncharacterized protein n=1 Tax=Ancylobacter vacuolatus TaxID=223389 RepID=A0ABU0DKE3_9HYPH|nr:hypothetical protein [Ancylobacter vacuolatus]MDQ0348903.1 hypothetical protein [Ancylobacter vacuolatus]